MRSWVVAPAQTYFPVLGIDRALLKRMLTFSLPVLPASLVGYMSSNYLDAFFITHYLSRADLGVCIRSHINSPALPYNFHYWQDYC